jgi:hypothetical protein
VLLEIVLEVMAQTAQAAELHGLHCQVRLHLQAVVVPALIWELYLLMEFHLYMGQAVDQAVQNLLHQLAPLRQPPAEIMAVV